MRTNHFIPILVALSLCIGQIASYAHVVSHLGAVPVHDAHADEHHVHKPVAPIGEKGHVSSSSSEEYADCAIYHAFAGTNGVPAICTGLASVFIARHSTTLDITPAVLVGSLNTLHIRGPPNFS